MYLIENTLRDLSLMRTASTDLQQGVKSANQVTRLTTLAGSDTP